MITQEAVVLFAVPVLFILAIIAQRRGWDFWRTLWSLTFVAYVAMALSVTFFPIPIDPRLIADRSELNYLQNNLVPLRTIADSFRDGPEPFALQVLGNLALLMPFGFLLPRLWPDMRRLDRAAPAFIATAIGIEAAQFAVSLGIGFTYRQADVDDLLLNTVGALIGYGIFLGTTAAGRRLGTRRNGENLAAETES